MNVHVYIPRTFRRSLLSIFAALIMLGTAKPAFAADGTAAAQFAMNQLGKPFVFGAEGPGSYDTGGLTKASWAAGGVALPHSITSQWNAVPHLPCGTALQAGDLVFKGTGVATTVAIFISGSTLVWMEGSGNVVRTLSYTSYMNAGGGPCYGIGRP